MFLHKLILRRTFFLRYSHLIFIAFLCYAFIVNFLFLIDCRHVQYFIFPTFGRSFPFFLVLLFWLFRDYRLFRLFWLFGIIRTCWARPLLVLFSFNFPLFFYLLDFLLFSFPFLSFLFLLTQLLVQLFLGYWLGF